MIKRERMQRILGKVRVCGMLMAGVILGCGNVTVQAASVTVGAFTVTGGVENEDYSYDNNTLTIKTATPLTIKNTDPDTATTTDHIFIESGVSANVTLAGVNIEIACMSPLEIAEDSTGDVTIELEDNTTNNLVCKYNSNNFAFAAIQKNGSYSESLGKLTIQCAHANEQGHTCSADCGQLRAKGCLAGAGIGGKSGQPSANINITGGIIEADGSNFAAGIGGGSMGSASHIMINGGRVTAKSGNGASIGGGWKGNGNDIQVLRGNVDAYASIQGCGIGAGDGGTSENITIAGGSVKATSNYGRGIGAQNNSKNIKITGGSVNAVVVGSIPVNAEGEEIYLLKTFENSSGADVYIDGACYPMTQHDEDDPCLYVWLPEGNHTVQVEEQTKYYIYVEEEGNGKFVTATDEGTDFVIMATDADDEIIVNEDYLYYNGRLIIQSDKAMTICNKDPNTATSDTIIIAKNIAANITLADVNINVTGSPALSVRAGNTSDHRVTLKKGTVNILRSPDNSGIQMNGNGTLTIACDDNTTGHACGDACGKLYANQKYIDNGCPGIELCAGKLKIDGGVITACAYKGAAIGTSEASKTNADITINGGIVDAKSYFSGAAIGAGFCAADVTVVIRGGVIDAWSKAGRAIGAGSGRADIVISGGVINATTGEKNPAAIGNAKENANIVISGGSVYAKVYDSDDKAFSSFPVDEQGRQVYLMTIDNQEKEPVLIDDKVYPVNTTLYVYLDAEEIHKIQIGDNVGYYGYSTTKGKFLQAPQKEDFTVILPENLTYDGNAKEVTVQIEDGVISEEQITVQYRDSKGQVLTQAPVNVGTYAVEIVVAEGDNNGAGILELTTFEIVQAELPDDPVHVVIPDKDNLVYDGGKKEVTIQTDLNIGTAIEVTYYQDGVVTDPVYAGDYTFQVTIPEGGNYHSKTLTSEDWRFTVTRAVLKKENLTVKAPEQLTYDGTKKNVSLSASSACKSGMGSVTVKYYNESGQETDPVLAGIYTVGIEVTEGKGYEATQEVLTSEDWTFTIERAILSASDFAVQLPDSEYDGKGKTVTVTPADAVKGAGIGQVTVQYYDGSGDNVDVPVQVGTYTYTIEVTEGKGYKATQEAITSENWTFTITQSDKEIPNTPATVMTPEHAIVKVGDIQLPEAWNWLEKYEETPLKDNKTITAIAVYDGADKDNYVSARQSVTIKITRQPCVHRYGEVTYEWTDSKVVCTASMTCVNKGCTEKDEDHVVMEKQAATDKVSVEPTCEKEGVRVYTVTFDNEKFEDQSTTESIPALKHMYSITYTVDKEATCTEKGSKSKHCSREDCTSTVDEIEIAALGHNWNKGVITTEPTTDMEGVKTYSCTRCEATRTESVSKLEDIVEETELEGSGTKEDPWIINNSEDLWTFAKKVYESETKEECAKVADGVTEIDTTVRGDKKNRKWNPIAQEKPYKGVFDGNGARIRIDIETSATTASCSGLFATIGGSCVIKNVTVAGDIRGSNNVGGICGEVYSDAVVQIINCNNEADITTTGSFAGGLVGKALGDTSIKSTGSIYNKGAIQGRDCVGGIVGSGDNITVTAEERIINEGAIAGLDCVGGIIGDAKKKEIVAGGEIRNSGNVIGTRGYVGGICGRLEGTTVQSVTDSIRNEGEVSGLSLVGGIVGRYEGIFGYNCKIEAQKSILNTGKIRSGGEYAGGICGDWHDNNTNISAEQGYVLNTGDVEGDADKVGGVFGSMLFMERDCGRYGNTGKVQNNGGQYTGGVIGYCVMPGYSIVNVFNAGEVITANAEAEFAGGIIGYFKGKDVRNAYHMASYPAIGNSGDQINHMTGALYNCYCTEQNQTPWSGEIVKASEAYTSGEVAYLLDGIGSKRNHTLFWGQEIGKEAFPLLGGKTVYQNGKVYSNTKENSDKEKPTADQPIPDKGLSGEDHTTETTQQPTADDMTGTTQQQNPGSGNIPAPKGTKITAESGAAYVVKDDNPEEPAVSYETPEITAAGMVEIPDTVTINGVEYKVTSIAKNAFKNNKQVTEVSIGKNVTSIGDNAFAGCSALKKVTIAENMVSIGKNAFKGCKKLKTITMKSAKLTKKSIKKGAFKGISSKTVFKVPKKKLKIYKKLFRQKGLNKKVKIIK